MNLEDIQIDSRKITEQELDTIYIYLSMTFDTMTDEEKDLWTTIMQKIDTEFYED